LTTPGPVASPRAAVAAAAAAAKNGEDVVVIHVGDIISIIDDFVLVSASNPRLVRTIVDEVEDAIREHDGGKPIGIEGRSDATWVLLDFGDIVVHVFHTDTRAYYDLERLWADAPTVEWEPAAATAADG
jgi:ribosome-associated protein